MYVGMGLVGLGPFPKYLARIDWRGMVWVAAFTGCYVLGAVVEVLRWPTLVPGWFGPHEFLHVADMAGTFLHYGFVVRFLIFQPPPTDGPAAVPTRPATASGRADGVV